MMKKLFLIVGLVFFLIPSLASSESLLDNLFKKGQDLLNQIKGDSFLTCPPNWGVNQLFKINPKKKTIYEYVDNGNGYEWIQLFAWYDYEGEALFGFDKTNVTLTRKNDGRIILKNKGDYIGTYKPNKSESMFTEKFITIRRISPQSLMQYGHRIGRFDLKYYRKTNDNYSSGECVLGDKRPKKKI